MRRSFLVGLSCVPLPRWPARRSPAGRTSGIGVDVDFHRMNCWPAPFQHADRQVAITPLIAMTDAGWRLQNTLTDNFLMWKVSP